MKNIIFLLSSALLLFACCKHHLVQPIIPTPKNTDVTIEQDTLENIVFDYSIDTLQCDTAHFKDILYNDGLPRLAVSPPPKIFVRNFCFNSQNNDEVFIPRVKDTIRKISCYNFVKKSEKDILILPKSIQNYMIGSSFTPNGWLLLTGGSGLYKVKTNGDSLTFLTSDVNFRPVWNQNGSKIAFRHYYDEDHFYIIDNLGNRLDTIYGEPGVEFDWTKKDVYARQRNDGSVIEYNTQNQTRRLLVPSLGTGRGICWLGDFKTIAVATMNGLYIVDTETQKYRKIRCTGWQNSYYLSPAYSKKHHRIFAVKSQLINCYVSEVYLISMNIDGSDEQIEARSIY